MECRGPFLALPPSIGKIQAFVVSVRTVANTVEFSEGNSANVREIHEESETLKHTIHRIDVGYERLSLLKKGKVVSVSFSRRLFLQETRALRSCVVLLEMGDPAACVKLGFPGG